MPRNLAALLQNIRPVQLPDPTKRFRTLADAKAMEQQSTLRGQAITQGQNEISSQQAQQQKQAALQQILEAATYDDAGGLSEETLRQIDAVDPQAGAGLRKSYADVNQSKASIVASQASQAKSAFDVFKGKQDLELEGNKAIETARNNREQEAIEREKIAKGSTAQPAAVIQEYNFYVEQEKKAGREPISFDKYQERDANRRAVRPPVPIVLQTPQGPQILDRTSGTTREITDAGGKAVPTMPTADMRNKAEGRKIVAKSINAIKSLSDKIITSVGPAQRADAIKRGAEAVFGTDPQFRTYQDARMALAGNLAVAQQGSRPSDADIKAIWLPLVPDPYRDTSESAKMKWELINTMSNVAEDGGGTNGGWSVKVKQQ